MNAIELLKKDHQEVSGLFEEYEGSGEGAASRKEELFGKIKSELDVHAAIEEEIFYPAAKQAPKGETKDLVLEAFEEHKEIKTLLGELEAMDAEDERFDAKMTLLKEDVEHHVEEEEGELFPKVQKALGRDRLEDLGRQMESRQQSLAGGREQAEAAEAEEVGGGAPSPRRRVRRAAVPRSSARASGRTRSSRSRGRGRSRSRR